MENFASDSQVDKSAVKRISYNVVHELTNKLAREMQGDSRLHNYASVYGVPRGGVPIAIMLAKQLGLSVAETPAHDSIIVDDICDSGATLARFNGALKVALFRKPHSKIVPDFIGAETDEWIEFPWEAQELPAEDAVLRIIQAIGENPRREGLLDTPKRVVKSWTDIFKGYKMQPESILSTKFAGEGYDQMVVLKDIEFFSNCEHHMLPFFGKAHIAYIPGKEVVGLSKLARLVECFSRRLQIQERLTQQIAEAMETHLKPRGVGVMIEAKHFCMVTRGVNKQNSIMKTTCLKGLIKDSQAAREEFLKMISV